MSRSNLATRVIVGVLAVPVVAGAVYLGDAALAGLLAVVCAIAAWEFYRIARAAGYQPLGWMGIVAAGVFPLVVHAGYLGLVRPSSTWLVMFALAVLGTAVMRRGAGGRPLSAAAITLFGVLYTAGFMTFAYALRYHNYAVGAVAGTAVLGFPILLTWASDTAGYAVGRSIGRHKLIPTVSPGKTIEGAVGALVITVLVALAYQHFVMVPYARLSFTTVGVVVFGLLVSVAVQFGDLFESAIKREAGVKDASNVLPGHGGMLDRIDGLLFALPVAYWLFEILQLVPVPVRP